MADQGMYSQHESCSMWCQKPILLSGPRDKAGCWHCMDVRSHHSRKPCLVREDHSLDALPNLHGCKRLLWGCVRNLAGMDTSLGACAASPGSTSRDAILQRQHH